MPTLKMTVAPDGGTTTEVHGITGPGCEKYIKGLKARFGVTEDQVDEQNKECYYDEVNQEEEEQVEEW